MEAELTELLSALHEVGGEGGKPLLVKLSPDLSDPAVAELLDVCLRTGVRGVIASNKRV